VDESLHRFNMGSYILRVGYLMRRDRAGPYHEELLEAAGEAEGLECINLLSERLKGLFAPPCRSIQSSQRPQFREGVNFKRLFEHIARGWSEKKTIKRVMPLNIKIFCRTLVPQLSWGSVAPVL
jgi:hypothetical protein